MSQTACGLKADDYMTYSSEEAVLLGIIISKKYCEVKAYEAVFHEQVLDRSTIGNSKRKKRMQPDRVQTETQLL